MQIRDAVEADAEALAARSSLPASAIRAAVHDRTVRVAVDDDADADDRSDDDAGDGGDAGTDSMAGGGLAPEDALGFLAYDAHRDAVHVTSFGGSAPALGRLLAEPVEFAAAENVAVEVLLTDDDTAMRRAVEDAGFEAVGSGPRFEGRATTRYRLAP